MTSWEHDIPKIKDLVEEHRVDMLDKKQMAEHASRDEDATRQERLDRQAESQGLGQGRERLPHAPRRDRPAAGVVMTSLYEDPRLAEILGVDVNLPTEERVKAVGEVISSAVKKLDDRGLSKFIDGLADIFGKPGLKNKR